jgi:hypothetical protein
VEDTTLQKKQKGRIMEHIEGIKRLIAYIHDFYLEMGEIGDVTLEDITGATFSFYAERIQKDEFLCWDADSIEREQIWNILKNN